MAEIVIDGVDAIGWDLDGTILNSVDLYTGLVTEIAPVFGRPVPSREVITANYHGSLREAIGAALGCNDEDQLTAMVDIFCEMQQDHYVDPSIHFFDDAITLSRQAAELGIAQVLVTNRPHNGNGKASPYEIVGNTELKDTIGQVLCSDECKYRKPDRRVLDGFMEEHDVTPEGLLIIGDQYVDAQLAMNLGSRAVMTCRDGEPLANAHLLADGWQDQIMVVQSLHDITVERLKVPRQDTV